MPTLDSYQSQRSVPGTTGTPQFPLALADQSALTQGAMDVSEKLAHTAYIMSIRENAQEQAEQTYQANELLLDHDRQLGDYANYLSDPARGFAPQAAKADYLKFATTREQEVMKSAAEIGGVAQEYAGARLRTYTDPHLKAFDSAMDQRRKEAGQFTFRNGAVANNDRAAQLGEAEQLQAKADMHQQGILAVNAGFEDGKSAAEFWNTESKRIDTEAAKASIRRDPAAFLLNPPTNTTNEAMEYARHDLAFIQGQQDRNAKEFDRVEKEGQGKNYLTGLENVGNGTLHSEEALRQFAEGPPGRPDLANPLDGAQYHTLQVAIKNRNEGVHSDPATLERLYTAAGQIDYKKWPTERQIWAAAESTPGNPATLSTDNATSLTKYVQGNREQLQQRGVTNYRQSGADAEERIKDIFKPFVGSIMDYDKAAALTQARALRDHQDLWNAGLDARGVPKEGVPSPLSWIDKVTMPHLVNFARQQKFAWETSALRNALPLEADSPDKVLALRKEGKITAQQAETATEWLRLLDTLDVMPQLTKPTTSSSGEVGGVKRNR